MTLIEQVRTVCSIVCSLCNSGGVQFNQHSSRACSMHLHVQPSTQPAHCVLRH